MFFDELNLSLAVGGLIVGFLAYVIIGSQSREDARPIALWSLAVVVPVLVASWALPFAVGGIGGAPGMVVLCMALIAAIGLGYRGAGSGRPRIPAAPKEPKIEPGFADDELA